MSILSYLVWIIASFLLNEMCHFDSSSHFDFFSFALRGALRSKLVIKRIANASTSLNRQLYLSYFLCYFTVTIDLKL